MSPWAKLYASADVTLVKRTLMKWTALWMPIRWPHGIKTAQRWTRRQRERDQRSLKTMFGN